MAPQHKGIPTPAQAERIRAAVEARDTAEAELVAAVVDALKAGASIRETAAVAGINERTAMRWGHANGWPTKAQKAAVQAKRDQRERRWRSTASTQRR